MLAAVSLKSAVWLWQVGSVTSPHELLRDVRVPLDTRFILAQLLDDGVLLLEVYHISDKLQLRRFSTWTRKSGLRGTTWDDFYGRRTNLQGTVIKVSSVQVFGLCFH
jgi:hypothetical protein